MMRRKILYSAEFIAGYRRALAEAREALADHDFKHRCRHAALMADLDALRAELGELKAAVLARTEAEAVVAALHRRREIELALAAERDLDQRLN
jgi:hypothetical protein